MYQHQFTVKHIILFIIVLIKITCGHVASLISASVYSISTLNSDKISKIWDEMRIKFGCSENKVRI